LPGAFTPCTLSHPERGSGPPFSGRQRPFLCTIGRRPVRSCPEGRQPWLHAIATRPDNTALGTGCVGVFVVC
jgi:hypothetical protein